MKDAANQTSMQSLSSIKIKYISDHIISLAAKYDTYCGGPYPENGETYSTYDVKSGVKIDLLTQVKDVGMFKSFLAKEFKNNIMLAGLDTVFLRKSQGRSRMFGVLDASV